MVLVYQTSTIFMMAAAAKILMTISDMCTETTTVIHDVCISSNNNHKRCLYIKQQSYTIFVYRTSNSYHIRYENDGGGGEDCHDYKRYVYIKQHQS